MNVNDFDYELPKELIAQTPLKVRDASRLLVMDKVSGEVEHKHFTDIIDYFSLLSIKGSATFMKYTFSVARVMAV